MTVINESPLCFKIYLNKYELKKYFTDYEKIIPNDPDVKNKIEFLFLIAGIKLKTDKKRIIEIYPAIYGGCMIKLTVETDNTHTSEYFKVLPVKSENYKTYKYMFCFNNADDLLNIIKKLYDNELSKQYNSSIYVINNKYYFKISIPISDKKTPVFISEYSAFSAKGKILYEIIAEYGKCIAENNAIEILGKYF